jgi:hypothetical protein
MEESGNDLLGLVFLVVGFVFIKKKVVLGQKASVLYRKIGVDVPEDLYAKQFVFIGVLLIVVGFLAATGMFQLL